MRLSVLAVSLILLFSQTIQAQHSPGGGGSSGGGGGSSAGGGGGGGGSHGAGSSGSGSSSGGYSGGHSSGGSGSRGSGSSGSAHGGNSSHGTPSAHGPGKTGVANEGTGFSAKAAARASYYSTIPGDSPVVHDHLLDQALARIRVEMPADYKMGQPVRVEIQKDKEPNRGSSADKKGKNKAGTVARIRLPKPCHGKKCLPPPLPTCGKDTRIAGCGEKEYVWRMSEGVYASIQDKCGYLAQRLAQEESRAAALSGQQQIACSPAPLSPECAPTTRAVAQSDLRIARLREQYERCVFSDLRHTALISMSRP